MIVSGPVCREVISLQKVDSLLVLEGNGELIRFLEINAGGIWIKIHLNLRSARLIVTNKDYDLILGKRP